VTVTSTVPFPFGETAVIDVAEFTVKLLAFVEPNLAAVASMKPVPVMVTVVLPLGEPWLGSTLVTVGSATLAVVNIRSGPYTIGGSHWIVSVVGTVFAAITRK
jgi:hypothetical protein